MNGITDMLDSKQYRPERAIKTVEVILNLQQAYDSDAGVEEDYSIRQHTLMVLLQFDRYFSHRSLPLNMTLSYWRLLLLLHDVLGKPEALRHGNKNLQHKFLQRNLPTAMRQLGYNEIDIKLGIELIGNDCIGSYIQDRTTPNDVIAQANPLSVTAHTSVNEAVDAMILYWMVDAGSYTEDAGGKRSLDYLFLFDRQHRTMELKDTVRKKILLLKSIVG
jgi:hypothetical protein